MLDSFKDKIKHLSKEALLSRRGFGRFTRGIFYFKIFDKLFCSDFGRKILGADSDDMLYEWYKALGHWIYSH